MKPILIIYATRQGQTRRIADHMGATIAAQQHLFSVIDAAHIPRELSLSKYSTVIVAASLHMGRFEPEVKSFVVRHVTELNQMPTLFLSVSLAAANAARETNSPEARAAAKAHVEQTLARFLSSTGWHPTRTDTAAGALAYSRYDFITRWIMKGIARKTGLPIDTAQDYEFTDWPKLDCLTREICQALPHLRAPLDAERQPRTPVVAS